MPRVRWRLSSTPWPGVGRVEGWSFVVVGAVDEEGDSRGARHLLTQGYRPRFAIVGEPSRWDRITIGYKGSAWTTVTVRRPLAHSAAAEPTACEAALAAWSSIQAWAEAFNRGRDRLFDRVVPSLQRWSSDDDGLQAWARIHLGARLPPDIEPQRWMETLQTIAQGAVVDWAGFATPAYRGEKNTPLTRAFLRAIRDAGGRAGLRHEDRDRRPQSRRPGLGLPGRRLRARGLVPRPHGAGTHLAGGVCAIGRRSRCDVARPHTTPVRTKGDLKPCSTVERGSALRRNSASPHRGALPDRGQAAGQPGAPQDRGRGHGSRRRSSTRHRVVDAFLGLGRR